MPTMRILFLFLLFTLPAEAQWWEVQTSGSDTNLRGVSAANAPDTKGALMPMVWASGSNGVILRSTDLGKTWKRLHVAGGDALDFRGIVAFNAATAYVMSSGEGEKSRIYKTTDGGETWTLQYAGNRKEIFLDSIACLSETHCFALSDPLDGKFLLLTTTDGEHWNPLPSGDMPAALPGEGAFAASNSCLLLSGGEIFFGSGGPAARVFHSTDKDAPGPSRKPRSPMATHRPEFSPSLAETKTKLLLSAGTTKIPYALPPLLRTPSTEAKLGSFPSSSPAGIALPWHVSTTHYAWPWVPMEKTSVSAKFPPPAGSPQIR